MALKIGICDDEKIEIEYLKKLVTNWGIKRAIETQVNTFESAESFLFEYAENKSFDILLLDIQMDQMNGVELAKKIRIDDESVQIIFITGIYEFIEEGYEVSALHYLIKPVSDEKLYDVLDKAMSRIQKIEKYIILNVDSENIRVQLSEILYIEAFAHNIEIHLVKGGSLTVLESMKKIEEKLDDSFIRCHRSYITGIRHIKRITKTDMILDDGKAIPLSRRLYNKVNQSFIKYFKGDL